MKYEHSILLVDDESSILKSLVRLLRKTEHTVHTASGGQEALELIKAAEKPFSVIVSDQRMPGMTGAEFLARSLEYLPNAIRFLLTGYSEIDSIVDAINKGQIHRFIQKPWNDNDLILTLEQGIRQYELVLENKRLLAVTQKQNSQLFQISKILDAKVKKRTEELNEKTKELEESFFSIIRSFSAITDSFTPEDAGHGRRVSALCNEIGKKIKLPEEELKDLEIAALLHDIGKIGLPKTPAAPYMENMSANEKSNYKRHSKEGHNILRFIPKLERASLFIKHHHENYDGSGFPDGLPEEEIPLCSRIIAVADAYDRISARTDTNDNPFVKEYARATGRTSEHIEQSELAHMAAIYYLKQNAFSLFDPNIIKAFLEILKTYGFNFQNERALSVDQLEAGMILTRPLYSEKGRFLLPYNTTLSISVIEKLKSIHEGDPIQEPVYAASY